MANLRTQLEALNKFTFTEGEWQRFFTQQLASANEGIVEKTSKIQTDHVQVLKRDDGSFKNVQDYQSLYLDLYADWRKVTVADKETINDDVVFEIELIKQVEVNVDYILLAVQQYLEQHGEPGDVEVRSSIERAIDARPSLRNKKDLIEAFVDSLTGDADVDREWKAFVAAKRSEDLDRIVSEETCGPRRLRSSFGGPSAMGPSRPQPRRSPASCRRSRGSPRPTFMASRRRPCSRGCQRSSGDFGLG